LIQVNYLAVLFAAIASMVVGSIWYGPLFGKMYTSVMGMDKMSPEQREAMKKGMAGMYIGQFVASLVMFYVLAWVIVGLGHHSLMGGLKTALLVWIGFFVPLKLGDALWGGKMTLFWLGIGNSLITLLVAGAIIGAMK